MVDVFCDARFSEPAEALLRAGCAGHRLIVSERANPSNLTASPADPAAAEAEVLFGQPSLDTLRQAPRARWVHLTSAGYERYATDGARALLSDRGLRLTSSSAVYAVPCAEQALAGMLMLARRFDLTLAEQAAARWDSARHRAASGLLFDAEVVLLGYGAIGRALAERLRPFGARISALRRHPSPDDAVPTFGEDALDARLEEADQVVNLLPGGEKTRHFMNAARFGRMKPGAYFVNVGRGTTVEPASLVEALLTGPLGGAYLDVTDPEPLPADDPLWTAPRCVVTPHVAGGRVGEDEALVRHFLDNLGRYVRGAPLSDEIETQTQT